MESTKMSKKSSSNIEEMKEIYTDIKILQEDVKEKLILENTSKLHNDLVPPNGGWGWMVVLGSFMCMVLGTFPLFSFGIIFSPLLMNSGVSSTTIAWIFNVHGLVWSLYAPFIGPLCEEYGWRKIAILGGISNFLSIFLSAFVLKPEFLFLTFSVFGGIGGVSGFTIGNLAVSRYFTKRRGFVLAIVSVGSSASSVVGPLIVNFLLNFYGYLGATIISAAFVLNQCVAGALFQPVDWHMKRTRPNKPGFEDSVDGMQERQSSYRNSLDVNSKPLTKLDDQSNKNLKNANNQISRAYKQKTRVWDQFKKILRLSYDNLTTLKFLKVKLIALGHSCLLIGYQNFQVWIPFVLTNAGYSLEMAAWCISAASIANFIGMISMSLLSDRKWFNLKYGYMFGLFFNGISIIVFAFANSIELFMASACCWGFGTGFSISAHVTISIHVMGVEMLPAVLGVASFLKGFIAIIYGPIVGFTRDVTSSYSYALFLLGGAEIFGFCLWLLMPYAIKYDQKKFKELADETVIERDI